MRIWLRVLRCGPPRPAAALLAVALALAACAPATPTAPAASGKPPSAPVVAPGGTDWNTILDAARREGVVQCACPPRPDYSKLLKEAFEAAHPGIRLETTPATLPDIWARVEKEQDAGLYLSDIYMFGPTIEMFALKNKGAFEPFRDYMVGPDIGDESVWEGGWDRAFLDTEKKYIFAFWLSVTTAVTINRDLLPNAQITTVDELLSPEYRGKLVWQDPRGGGIGVSFLTGLYHYRGREGVQRLLVDQQPQLIRGNVEVTEQVVRGGRAISVAALTPDTLLPLEQAGIRLNLENVALRDIPSVTNGGLAPAVFKRPPHPNATKVFVNWALSRQAQDLFARQLLQQPTRKDVAARDAFDKPVPGVNYFHTQLEESMETATREAQRLARELVP